VRSAFFGRAVLMLATILVLAACATGSPPRSSSSGSPTVRCIDEPGRGQSPESTRPLFFLFCAQTP
jgi:hypothetical protein